MSRVLFLAALAVAAFAIPAAAQDADSAKPAELTAQEPIASAAPVATAEKFAAPVHPWVHPVAPAAQGSTQGDDSDYHGSFIFYGFFSTFNGKVRAGQEFVQVDRSLGDIADVLKFAAGARVEVQRDKWGLAFDNNYVHVGDDVISNQELLPDFRFDLSLNVTEIEPSYRFYSSGVQDAPIKGPMMAIDLIGGVRIIHPNVGIELRRPILPTVLRDQSATYVQGYIGGKVVGALSRYFSLETRYNVALASDYSWFLNTTAYVQPWDHFAFGGGFQILSLNVNSDDKDAAVDANFSGPVVNLKFVF